MTIELSAMFRASRAKNRGNPRGVRIARRRGMDPAEFDRLITRAEDPRLIPGVYNYCDGRCPRCPFTQRCLTFLDSQKLQSDDGVKPLARRLASHSNGHSRCSRKPLGAAVAMPTFRLVRRRRLSPTS